MAPEQLDGVDEARVQRRRPPHPWRARAPLRRRPREPERGLGGPRPGGGVAADRVVAMRVVVVVVALQERERLRGVVHGDAPDGPHGRQVPAEAAAGAALGEDGLGVVQKREGQVGVRARRHLMMMLVRARRRHRRVVSHGCRRRRGGESEGGGGRGGRCSSRRRRRCCSRRRGGV